MFATGWVAHAAVFNVRPLRAIEVLMEVVSAIGPGDDYPMLDGRPVI